MKKIITDLIKLLKDWGIDYYFSDEYMVVRDRNNDDLCVVEVVSEDTLKLREGCLLEEEDFAELSYMKIFYRIKYCYQTGTRVYPSNTRDMLFGYMKAYPEAEILVYFTEDDEDPFIGYRPFLQEDLEVDLVNCTWFNEHYFRDREDLEEYLYDNPEFTDIKDSTDIDEVRKYIEDNCVFSNYIAITTLP